MQALGRTTISACAFTLTLSLGAMAATGPIYIFKNKPAGLGPVGPLTADAQGNLYGTAFNGGVPPGPNGTCATSLGGCGVVFKLTQDTSGSWTYSVLYKFQGAPLDGQDPTDVLAIDSAGNIYGTTVYGGSVQGGTVYELSPAAGGSYTEKVLYAFTGVPGGTSTDGSYPNGVILSPDGNLYGTTGVGGQYGNYGTVWELTPNGSGGWTEQILHSFGNGTDGQNPPTALLRDSAGNLYGTTANGGLHAGGTAFELSPSSGGSWTESVLHNFGAPGDACFPQSALIDDSSGNLYGTAWGCAGYGIAFELSPSTGGYTESVLHFFSNANTGVYPMGPLVFGANGNLYGTTQQGGQANAGTIFELSKSAGGQWTASGIHDFNGSSEGAFPFFGLTFGPGGQLYGTTPAGGSAAGYAGFGVVFAAHPYPPK